jgi:CBS domain-containing protein
VQAIGKAKRVRIYLNEHDRIGHEPADLALLELLRREGARGATVLRGAGGFGSSGELHLAHLVDTPPRLPVVVEWIDAVETVDGLLPRVAELAPRGLITVDETEIVVQAKVPVRGLPSLTAGDVMTREVASVPRDAPLRDVVELALGKVYRALPVVDGRRPVGIVTSGDLVERGGLTVRLDLLRSLTRPEVQAELERLAAAAKVAADVMTSPVLTVRDGAPLAAVAEVMARRKLKRVPVVDAAGELVGIVARVDLLRTAARGLERREPVARELGLAGDAPLARVMRRDVPSVHPDTPLADVFQVVISTRLNRAIVVDDDRRVIGLVTDAELLDRVTPSLRPGALRSLAHRLPFRHLDPETATTERHARASTARELMRKDVGLAGEEMLLSEAIALMLHGKHKILAVTDREGRLAGLVDRADLLHALVRHS